MVLFQFCQCQFGLIVPGVDAAGDAVHVLTPPLGRMSFRKKLGRMSFRGEKNA